MYGFRSRGEGGLVQIDSRYSNFVLLSKGTITLSDKSRGYNTATLSVPAPSGAACIALVGKSGAYPVGMMSCVYDGTNLTCLLVGNMPTGTLTADWYCFIPVEYANSGADFGLRVRLDAGATLGAVAFDSNFKYMHVVGLIRPNYNEDIFTGESGRKYAALIPGPYWESAREWEPDGDVYDRIDYTDSAGVYSYGNGIRAATVTLLMEIITSGSSGRSTYNWYGNSDYAIIDVTNF